jgi:hypothetical protein
MAEDYSEYINVYVVCVWCVNDSICLWLECERLKSGYAYIPRSKYTFVHVHNCLNTHTHTHTQVMEYIPNGVSVRSILENHPLAHNLAPETGASSIHCTSMCVFMRVCACVSCSMVYVVHVYWEWRNHTTHYVCARARASTHTQQSRFLSCV